MKRAGNLFDKIVNIENLKEADKKARKGKSNQYGVQKHLENEEENIHNLYYNLKRGEYKTSEYKVFKINDPKERLIFKLPYYP